MTEKYPDLAGFPEKVYSTFPWTMTLTRVFLMDKDTGERFAALADCNGLIYTERQILDLLDEIRPFYERFSQADVRALNQRTIDQYFTPRSSDKQSCHSAHKPRPGYVYLMSVKGRYKIGITTDVQRRQRSISAAVGLPVEIVTAAYREDASDTEKALHDKYAKKRLQGEWFALNENDVTAIKEWLNEINHGCNEESKESHR